MHPHQRLSINIIFESFWYFEYASVLTQWYQISHITSIFLSLSKIFLFLRHCLLPYTLLFLCQPQCLPPVQPALHSTVCSSCMSSFPLPLSLSLVFSLFFRTLRASLVVEWGVLSVSRSQGNTAQSRGALEWEFGEAGCVRGGDGEWGIRGEERWGRADKHERGNKREEGLNKESK